MKVETVTVELPDELAELLVPAEEAREHFAAMEASDLPAMPSDDAMADAVARALASPDRSTLTRSLASAMCSACREGDCVQRITVHEDGNCTTQHGVTHVPRGAA